MGLPLAAANEHPARLNGPGLQQTLKGNGMERDGSSAIMLFRTRQMQHYFFRIKKSPNHRPVRLPNDDRPLNGDD